MTDIAMEITREAFDALPTRQQPLNTDGSGSAPWREDDRIVRFTGRWSLYGDEVEIRQANFVAEGPAS